jgi:2-phospho-L-lactate guanylyltransferase
VTPFEIDALAAKQTEPTVRLASARDGDGTNGLMISPPKLIETTFGIGSFVRHRKIAENAGAHVDTIQGEGISFDIDTPEDLIAFCAVDAVSETHTFLDLSGIRRRLLAENS